MIAGTQAGSRRFIQAFRLCDVIRLNHDATPSPKRYKFPSLPDKRAKLGTYLYNVQTFTITKEKKGHSIMQFIVGSQQ